MGRSPCCDKANVKKGPWSLEENFKLKEYIDKYGTGGNWLALPQKVGLKRCGKSCRLRWLNYLRPNLKHGGFSEEEENIICSLYISIGSRWSIIAAQLPGRTDNDIKNYWNTKLKKKLFGKRKDHQIRRLAEAKQERKDMQSYETAEANPSPNIYWPRQHTGGVDQRTNMGINGPYPNFGPGIASHLFEQNCGQRITESSSSSEPATFLVDPQQVLLDQELSDYNNSCLRTLLQMLEGGLVDQHSNNMMAMISHRSPVEASKCTNASEILYSTYNQHNWSQISYETSASPVPMHAGYHIPLENPSASSSAKGGSYESTWMNNFDAESNNVDGWSLGFSRELNDLYSLGGHGSDWT